MAKNGSDAHIIGVILYPDSDTFNSAKQIQRIWDRYYESCDICYILHDKDVGKDGEKELKPHYHLFIRFQGNNSKDKFQKDFDISKSKIFDVNQFRSEYELQENKSSEIQFKPWEWCVQYCAHRVPEAKHKYQYPIKDIVANFDITKYFKELQPTDPDWKVADRIKRWAKKNHATEEMVWDYCVRNNYMQAYKRWYSQLKSMLSGYYWWNGSYEMLPEDLVDINDSEPLS